MCCPSLQLGRGRADPCPAPHVHTPRRPPASHVRRERAMAAPAEVPMDLGSWIGRRAAATPRLPAITFDGHTTSYGELLDRIDRLAAELAAGGAGRGDRVGYLGLNDPMFLITLFAAARIGAVFVPLNYRLTAAELGYILTDAGV